MVTAVTVTEKEDMNTAEIKSIVDDERAEQLTAQLCHHWDVATQRLDTLAQEVTNGMDTCAEAEIYAALIRMQRAVMALMELNKIPTAFLFSEYLDRISQTITNPSVQKSVMTLFLQLQQLDETPANKEEASFLDQVIQMIAQHHALPKEQQEAIQQKFSYIDYILKVCAQNLDTKNLMMILPIFQEIKTEGNKDDQEEITSFIQDAQRTMETLDSQMNESRLAMVIELVILALLPGILLKVMQNSRSNSQKMAQLFTKVLMQVRESNRWWEYWKEHCATLRVVSDSNSWRDTMTAERTKERLELGQIPGSLFAKWTTDRKAFDEFFLDAHLDDDALRHFIFHLATLSEIAREFNPTSKFGDEQLVMDDQQRVGEGVLEAAHKLDNLVAKAWFPYYDAIWQELINDETIFAHLKVTRKSPHNNLFTARFFCHLVGEMKKSAVFGAHSDSDLAEKLTEKRYVGTFRKNIQEGMGEEEENVRKIFNSIYQKYKQLANTHR